MYTYAQCPGEAIAKHRHLPVQNIFKGEKPLFLDDSVGVAEPPQLPLRGLVVRTKILGFSLLTFEPLKSAGVGLNHLLDGFSVFWPKVLYPRLAGLKLLLTLETDEGSHL